VPDDRRCTSPAGQCILADQQPWMIWNSQFHNTSGLTTVHLERGPASQLVHLVGLCQRPCALRSTDVTCTPGHCENLDRRFQATHAPRPGRCFRCRTVPTIQNCRREWRSLRVLATSRRAIISQPRPYSQLQELQNDKQWQT